MHKVSIAINPVQIVLQQMDKLNRLAEKVTDPENACRIAGCIAELGAAVIGKADGEMNLQLDDIPDGNDTISYKEACLFLRMGATSLNREIAENPDFPVYQPGGKGGRKYFSKKQLMIWQEKKLREPKKEQIMHKATPGKLWQVQ